MHAGSLDTSLLLLRTLAVLADGREHTTAEIQAATGSMAVHSDIAALKAPRNGVTITRARYVGKSETGRKMYAYRLITGYGRVLAL